MADFESLKKMIIDGDDAATAATQQLVDGGTTAREILDEALLPGMDVVGARDEERGEVHPRGPPQRAYHAVLPRPHQAAPRRRWRIARHHRHRHRRGRRPRHRQEPRRHAAEGAGFEVVNLGVGITAADFVAAVEEHNADILGLSGMLTTTIPKMPETIQALKDAGLRDRVKVIVGGAPVSPEWADEIGADACGANASLAVEKCKELVS